MSTATDLQTRFTIRLSMNDAGHFRLAGAGLYCFFQQYDPLIDPQAGVSLATQQSHLSLLPHLLQQGLDVRCLASAYFGESYHLFRSYVTTPSERSDAGRLSIGKW